MWVGTATLAALVLGLAGCYTNERPRVKKPKYEEVYALPPENDSRWEKPVEYPKGALNEDTIKNKEKDKGAPDMKGPTGPRFGGGPGGGGY
jgi:hypothetical protein